MTRFCSFALTCALGCGGLVYAAPSDGDAAALRAKHHAYVGWTDGDGSVTSMKLTFTDKPNVARLVQPAPAGAPTPAALAGRDDVFVLGPRVRDVLTGGERAGSSESGFDGHAFWEANENGNVVTLVGPRARNETSWNAIWLERTAALPGSVRGNATIGGVATSVVRVEPPGGDVVDLYVDPATGAYRRVTIDPGADDAITIDIDRYDEVVPGKRLLAAYHVGNGSESVLTHAEIDVPVSEADVALPKPRTSWTFGSTDPVPIQIRAHTQQFGAAGSAVVVRASVDGHPGLFELDSGAGGILLNGSFATFLNDAAIGTSTYVGSNGGRAHSRLARVKDFAFGSNVLHDAVVSVGETGVVASSGVDGIVGYDFFAQALVDVDLDAKQMTILDPTRFAPSTAANAHVFDVDLSRYVPVVDVSIDGKFTARPIIDSGDDLFVILSASLQRRGAAPAMDLGDIYFGGVDGTSQIPAPCGRTPELRLGSIRYVNAPTCFGPDAAVGRDGGLLGFDFLRHFNWTFDYPDGRIVLTPNSAR